MRFSEQNKKKLNPRYFLNEEETKDKEETVLPTDQYKYEPYERDIEAEKKFLQTIGREGPSGTPAPSPPLNIASKGTQFVKCQNGATIQKAAIELIKNNMPDSAEKQKIIKRLDDNGKVGATTTSVINLAVKELRGTPIPLNMKGYQDVCNRPESFVTLVVKEINKMNPQAVAQAVLGGQKQLAQVEPTEAPAITEMKNRNASYNRINEQKQKKLFETLVKG